MANQKENIFQFRCVFVRGRMFLLPVGDWANLESYSPWVGPKAASQAELVRGKPAKKGLWLAKRLWVETYPIFFWHENHTKLITPFRWGIWPTPVFFLQLLPATWCSYDFNWPAWFRFGTVRNGTHTHTGSLPFFCSEEKTAARCKDCFCQKMLMDPKHSDLLREGWLFPLLQQKPLRTRFWFSMVLTEGSGIVLEGSCQRLVVGFGHLNFQSLLFGLHHAVGIRKCTHAMLSLGSKAFHVSKKTPKEKTKRGNT